MVSKRFIIGHPIGMHMRPAALFVNAAEPVESKVTVNCKGKHINGKSVMMLIAAGIRNGDEIEVVCDGTDEILALERITAVMESDFNHV